MKQRLLWSMIVSMSLLQIAPTFVSAQDEKSAVNWTSNLTWQQIQQKAKKENKYIFVDCFTTWCAPCKKMDKEVYTVDSVGDFLNNGFISVKLQMDVTNNDNEMVRSWYKTAKDMESQYRISAYPSYIFFAPGGEVVSKGIGYKEAPAFMQVVRDVTNPSKQYFVLLKKYKAGKLDHASTVSFINLVKQIGDTSDYNQLLANYYSYLNKMKKDKLYTKENIEFVASTLEKSDQLLFKMFYPDGSEVNKVMKSGWYAKKLVDKMIEKEIYIPFLNASIGKGEPDWNALYNAIAKKYNADYVARNVLGAKIKWHSADKDPLIYATLFNDKMEKYGYDTASPGDNFKLNNKAFLLWQKLDDTVQLERMIKWMETVVRTSEKATGDYFGYWPLYIDTYANLLYKVGKNSEAIKWQELAVAKGLERKAEEGDQKTFEENLALMKKGQPTW